MANVATALLSLHVCCPAQEEAFGAHQGHGQALSRGAVRLYDLTTPPTPAGPERPIWTDVTMREKAREPGSQRNCQKVT